MKLSERISSCWTKFTNGLQWCCTNLRRLLRILLIALVAYVVLVPLLHPVLVMVWRFMPVIVVPLIGGGITYWLVRRRRQAALAAPVDSSGTAPATPRRAAVVRQFAFPALSLMLTLLATGWVVFANTADWWIQSRMAAALDQEELSELPETIDNRHLPRPTAQYYTRSANTDNWLKPGEPHIVAPGDGKMWWQAPLHWNVWYNFFGSVERVVRIDAGSAQSQADPDTGKDASFWFGDQSWVTEWLFRLRHPFSERGETVYWKDSETGKWSFLVSTKTYRMTWTGTMLPEVGSVMQFGQRGTFSNYSVEEAAEKFKGAALYPPDLGRQYVEAYCTYHAGVDNAWVWKKGLLEISEDDNQSANLNRLPYYEEFNGYGLQQVFPLEPLGPESYALSKVLFFDAITGKPRAFTPKFGSNLKGPREALHNVVSGQLIPDKTIYVPLEPRLVHSKAKGTFYLITIVRVNSNDNSYPFFSLVLVDAQTFAAKSFDSSEKLHKFLQQP